MDGSGKRYFVKNIESSGQEKLNFQIGTKLISGIYFVLVHGRNGEWFSTKFLAASITR